MTICKAIAGTPLSSSKPRHSSEQISRREANQQIWNQYFEGRWIAIDRADVISNLPDQFCVGSIPSLEIAKKASNAERKGVERATASVQNRLERGKAPLFAAVFFMRARQAD
jgi:hypothetical protein